MHGKAQVAWLECDDQVFVFVNGADRSIDKEALTLVKTLCADRQLSLCPDTMERHRELMLWMAGEGLFDGFHTGK